MIQDPQGLAMALFLAFCRVAGCIMVLPGFSTARVPTTFRLLLAVTVSLAINNLFDTKPPRDDTWASYPYYNSNYYDGLGRTGFLQITYKMK
jgi:flagellar biosynthesis protein FliR